MRHTGLDLRLYSNSIVKGLGVLAVLALSACKQPETFVPGYSDRFTNYVEDRYEQADQLLQADYMFVLDYSYSMSGGSSSTSNIISNLFSSMDEFTQELHLKNTDYNIGIVKGNSHANSASTISTGFMGPFITLNSTAQGANNQIMAQIETIGRANTENTNYLLESALRVSKNQEGSFMRDASQLVYVFFTDSEDLSDKNSRIPGAKTSTYYINELKKFRPNAAYISAFSFTAKTNAGCTTSPSASWELPAPRIRAVAQGLDAMGTAPKCVFDSMSDSLRDLARDVTKTTKRFLMRGKPAPGSMKVFVNNAEVPTAANWSFLAGSNEVVFEDGKEPPVSTASSTTQVRFEYEMLYPLAKTPKVSSIVVQVNGQTVSKSDTNGWTYVDAENRIEFNGSAIPAHEADVRVNYTLH